MESRLRGKDRSPMLVSGEGVDLTLAELQEMATRQQQQIETQQQMLVAKEQRLKFLKQQEMKHQQIASENERLRKLREKVEGQEIKLKKLRALRGQADQQKTSNSSLTAELDSIRNLFSEKEKELHNAVTRVETLTRQLEEIRRGKMNGLNSSNIHSPATIELDKLRRELMIRNKLNEQQQRKLSAQKDALQGKQGEMSIIDKRIEELTQRLRKKRQMNQQQMHTGGDVLDKNKPRPLSGNIAAVEPYQHVPYNSAAEDIHMKMANIPPQQQFDRPEPKYMSLPMHNRQPLSEPSKVNDKSSYGSVSNGDVPSKEYDHRLSPTKGHATALAVMEETLHESKNVVDPLSLHVSEKLGVSQADSSRKQDSPEVRVSSPPYSSVAPKTQKLADATVERRSPTLPVSGRLQPPAFMRPHKREPITINVSKAAGGAHQPSPPTSVSSLSSASSASADDKHPDAPAPTSDSKDKTSESDSTLDESKGDTNEKPTRDTSPEKGPTAAVAKPAGSSESVEPSSKFQPRTVSSGRFMNRLGVGAMEKYQKQMNKLYSPVKIPGEITKPTESDHQSPVTSPASVSSAQVAEKEKSPEASQEAVPASSEDEPKVVSGTQAEEKASRAEEKKPPPGRNRQIQIPPAFMLQDRGDETSATSSKVPKYVNPPRYPGSPNAHFPLIDTFIPNITKSVKKRHSFTEAIPGLTNLEGRVTSPEVQFFQREHDTLEAKLQQEQPALQAEEVNIDKVLKEDDEEEEETSSEQVSLVTPPTSPPVKSESPPSVEVVRDVKKPSMRQKTTEKHSKRRVSFDPLALLLDASLEGELELVMKTAKEVPNPSASNDEGITALHNAICAGHYDIVKFLVEFGCNVNAADSDGWTPLHCAASCNNLPMVKFLVVHGACVFATTYSDHETAAEKCEEDEEGFAGCSEYLYGIQEKLGVMNNGAIYAVFDYKSSETDELSFKDGDMMFVLRKGDETESEWWWARHKDREGYIPRNLLGLYPRVKSS